MERRRYLTALGTAAIGAFAGCTSSLPDDPTASPTPTQADTPTESSGASGAGSVGNVELPVPQSALNRGAAKDAIPAITDPVFGEDWSGLTVPSNFGDTTEPRLSPDDEVVGVERDGEARAYPLKVLNWHEIVNDTLDGPLLVTYCPLCGSAVTAVRTVNGEETVFGVSGLLFRNDLVMYDRATGSLWSQILATAIRGPETGDRLDLVPSTLTTWGAWREEHPETVVLLPPPKSNTVNGEVSRDYTRDPYAGYEETDRIGLGGAYDDDRLHPKATVIGITNGGVARAYPLQVVTEEGVVNDEVGGLPVVVAVGPGDALVAYERRVDGETLTFAPDGDRHMTGGGSRWRILSGTAVDGPHEGTTLSQANDVSPEFFFAWKSFHEDTEVYGSTSQQASDSPSTTG